MSRHLAAAKAQVSGESLIAIQAADAFQYRGINLLVLQNGETVEFPHGIKYTKDE